mgnify:CR=1 FL=1
MKAVIAAYARSPFHFARKGRLAEMRPDTLAAQVVQGLLKRSDLDSALLEDVILGCAYPEASQGNNLARIVGLLDRLAELYGEDRYRVSPLLRRHLWNGRPLASGDELEVSFNGFSLSTRVL